MTRTLCNTLCRRRLFGLNVIHGGQIDGRILDIKKTQKRFFTNR
jgi:hypothetical protein